MTTTASTSGEDYAGDHRGESAEREWMLISTAPKDVNGPAKWLLVYDDETKGQYVACWIPDVEDYVPCGWDWYGDSITATHWMPLPKPPTTSAAQSGR